MHPIPLLVLLLIPLLPFAYARARPLGIFPSPDFQTIIKSSGFLSSGVEWKGTAPLCQATCDSDEVRILKAKSDGDIAVLAAFGKDCLPFFEKSLCTSQYSSCASSPSALPHRSLRVGTANPQLLQAVPRARHFPYSAGRAEIHQACGRRTS
ncbi:hypothetical protein CALCODRAFT_503665 [Calocera cornea HHB12733]|uniref:Uncharacterized protein n=1 Tax=Calocera cornea HHB12733 TaxID=1353952 RepID=A0A165CSI0_9BASI|nr:hypothetical protein CALCODRAFT_503665 [Calocera cornea HHB12733]